MFSFLKIVFYEILILNSTAGDSQSKRAFSEKEQLYLCYTPLFPGVPRYDPLLVFTSTLFLATEKL